MSPKTLFIFTGKPNSGKGTISRVMEKSLGILILCPGEICRQELEANTSLANEARKYMAASGSTLWPAKLLMRAIQFHLSKFRSQAHVALDGFLRRPEAVEDVIYLIDHYHFKRAVLLEVDITDEQCIKRANKRKRKDDKEIQNRLLDYHKHTLPAVNTLLAVSSKIPIQRIILPGLQMKKDAKAFIEGLSTLYDLPKRLPGKKNQ